MTSPAAFSGLEHEVRDLVGMAWDSQHDRMPERFSPARSLSVTAVSNAYEFAHHAVVSLCGTPPRGTIIVALYGTQLVQGYDLVADQPLTPGEANLLRDFISHVSQKRIDKLPQDFRWRSVKPHTQRSD